MNIVLIVPADLKDKANALGAAMGWGPDSYSVPLSADSGEPATHWGLNIANAGEDFITLLEGAAKGQMPEHLDFPPEDFAKVLGGLIDAADMPFDEALKAEGLQTLEPKDV